MRSPIGIRQRPARAQRGVSLIEALLAFLVLALGVLSMSTLHRHLQGHADLARQRSEAVRLAQEDIESVRAYASLQAPAGAVSGAVAYASIDTITSSTESLGDAALNTEFHLTRQVADSASMRLKEVRVSVAWAARDGSLQRAIVHSVIAGQSPSLAGALTLVPGIRTLAGSYARAAGIPIAARQLGDGRSALKPRIAGTIAVVFDNLSGQVTQSCTEVPSDVSTAQLTAEHLTHCVTAQGLWLSGAVRFSDANPPDAEAANDTPLDLAVSVALPSAVATTSPWCVTEAQKTVLYRAADGLHRQMVPLASAPASLGVSEWTELGERAVAYHCLVPATGSPARWSGISTLVPLAWTIGDTAADRKVCRYTWDRDGSGTIDRNDEHPAAYSNVDGPLAQQNFLVIRGDLVCPDGTAARMDGSPNPVSTVQHQP